MKPIGGVSNLHRQDIALQVAMRYKHIISTVIQVHSFYVQFQYGASSIVTRNIIWEIDISIV